MNGHSSLDRETFQALLANAFAVQESGMNNQSLSGLIEIHKAIAKEQLPFEKILDLIADRARIVADATGSAIGLLSGDQLIYPAGSGSGAQYVGQHVTAVLSASVRTGPRREILRVDNAENDARIEAAICRACDAKALLIMPVYNAQFTAGVLEVIFRDPHSFDDGEIRTYRMMAKLVEEAIAQHLQHSQGKRATHFTTTQPSTGKTPSLMQGSPTAGNPAPNPSVAHVSSATAAAPSAIPAQCSPATQAASTKWLLKRASFRNSPWIFDATLLVFIVGLTAWISLHQHVASTIEPVSLTRTTATGESVHERPLNNLSNTPSGTHHRNAPRPGFMRVQVGPNEVDYVAEDVTIRQFTTPVSLSHSPSVDERFNIGDDVTVHTYKYKADVLPENSGVKNDAIHNAPRH